MNSRKSHRIRFCGLKPHREEVANGVPTNAFRSEQLKVHGWVFTATDVNLGDLRFNVSEQRGLLKVKQQEPHWLISVCEQPVRWVSSGTQSELSEIRYGRLGTVNPKNHIWEEIRLESDLPTVWTHPLEQRLFRMWDCSFHLWISFSVEELNYFDFKHFIVSLLQ